MKWLTVGVFCLFSWVAAAAQIDGAWSGEMKSGGKKGGGQVSQIDPEPEERRATA